jgi:biopolymer transport protein ExbD
MKFPRNAKILRSPFEMAPFAAMFFLLVIFMLLAALLPVPGVPLQLPVVNDLPGIDRPTVAMAVDSSGRFFFANQMVSDVQLGSDLRDAARKSRAPLTLVIHADKSVTEEQLIHLALLAGTNGIQSALLATLPGAAGAPARP